MNELFSANNMILAGLFVGGIVVVLLRQSGLVDKIEKILEKPARKVEDSANVINTLADRLSITLDVSTKYYAEANTRLANEKGELTHRLTIAEKRIEDQDLQQNRYTLQIEKLLNEQALHDKADQECNAKVVALETRIVALEGKILALETLNIRLQSGLNEKGNKE